MEPLTNFFLVVLHALGFVEHPDDVNFGFTHQPDQFLCHLAKSGTIAFDHASNFTRHLTRSQVFADDVQARNIHRTDVHFDVRHSQALSLFDFLLCDDGPRDSARRIPHSHRPRDIVDSIGRYGRLFNILSELFLDPFFIEDGIEHRLQLVQRPLEDNERKGNQ